MSTGAVIKNLLVVAVSTVVALAAGEVVVRALLKDQTVMFPRHHTDYRYGQYALRGIRANAEFRHSSIDGSWTFVTNSRGFRDRRDFDYAKPAGTLRVLSLGDSHTQGYEVRQEATFSAVLERALARRGLRAEVLNAGVSGYSTAEAEKAIVLDANLAAVEVVGEVAAAHGVTAGQVALAWSLARGPDVVPIPGTKRIAYLEENVGAADVELSAEDLTRLDDVTAVGERWVDPTWIYRTTPPQTA